VYYSGLGGTLLQWVIPTVVLILAIPRGNPSVIVKDSLCKPIAYILSGMLTKGRTWVLCLLNYLLTDSTNPLQHCHSTNDWSVQSWDFRYFRPVIPKPCSAGPWFSASDSQEFRQFNYNYKSSSCQFLPSRLRRPNTGGIIIFSV
jgi:hypothetical protein